MNYKELRDFDSACEKRDMYINRLIKNGELKKPKYRPILVLDGSDIHSLIDVFVSTMLYTKGYYHLFDGRYSVVSWNYGEGLDDTVIIESKDNATGMINRIDTIDHIGIAKLFVEISKALEGYDDFYEL
jgi:hypothetical protein